ncbi:unnamed protein product [Zymoseptoria tritici ST99CH_3D1]|nr:unnamed protein product [Zymoseptoria tritici ST99CH_3D1]
MPSDSAKGVTASLGKLKIAPHKKSAPAESWEDEADDSSDTETEISTPPPRPDSVNVPGPPPPTPSSPRRQKAIDAQYQSLPAFNFVDGTFDTASASSDTLASRSTGEERRPDKTTSVASRLIAAGIGQKAPRRTEEQRKYDQAMKVQEKKRRDKIKEEEERKKKEAEQAKKDIWGD